MLILSRAGTRIIWPSWCVESYVTETGIWWILPPKTWRFLKNSRHFHELIVEHPKTWRNDATWLDPPPNKNPTRPTKRRRSFLVNFPIFLDRKYNKSLNIIVLTSKKLLSRHSRYIISCSILYIYIYILARRNQPPLHHPDPPLYFHHHFKTVSNITPIFIKFQNSLTNNINNSQHHQEFHQRLRATSPQLKIINFIKNYSQNIQEILWRIFYTPVHPLRHQVWKPRPASSRGGTGGDWCVWLFSGGR